jgi:hypothetical protein
MGSQEKEQPRMPGTNRKVWYADAAFYLGKTARKVSGKAEKAGGALRKGVSLAGRSFAEGLETGLAGADRPRVVRARTMRDPLEKQISPILKELKAIADVSGFSGVLRKINEIGAQHSSDPALERLFTRIGSFSPEEQEKLSRAFIQRLGENPAFMRVMNISPAQNGMTQEDYRKISESLIEAAALALEDNGVAREEGEFLRRMTGEMLDPLHEWLQFYLAPKTFSQKVKRLWRIQRIFFKMIKLIHKTKGLAAMPGSRNLRRSYGTKRSGDTQRESTHISRCRDQSRAAGPGFSRAGNRP